MKGHISVTLFFISHSFTSIFEQMYDSYNTKSTSPSQNIPPFSTNSYERPSHNPPLPPKYTLPFQQPMRHPQHLPSLPEYNPPPLSTTILFCDAPIIYPSVPEYTPPPPPFNNYIRPSHELALPPRIHIPVLTAVCPPPLGLLRINLSFPFYNICDIPKIYPSVTEYTPCSRNYMYM